MFNFFNSPAVVALIILAIFAAGVNQMVPGIAADVLTLAGL